MQSDSEDIHNLVGAIIDCYNSSYEVLYVKKQNGISEKDRILCLRMHYFIAAAERAAGIPDGVPFRLLYE